MPDSRDSSLKNPEMYEALRKEGNSKQKTARISNAAAQEGAAEIGRRGGKSGSYDDWTVSELRKRAKELGLKGYSSMTKQELIGALRES